MKLFTIQDLANGKCAMRNDGTVEEAIEVLKKAFPKDKYNYGEKDSWYLNQEFMWKPRGRAWWTWDSGNETDLPTQSVKDFLEPVGFVKGKWYKGQKDDHYIKFDSYEKGFDYDKIHFTEGITDCNYKLEKDYWANLDFKRYALSNPVSLEEIQKYLPEGHEDLISKEDSKESLLEEAERRYPIGTRIISPYSGVKFTAETGHFRIDKTTGSIITGIHVVKLGSTGKWAEIIEDKPKITKEYLTQKYMVFHCETKEENIEFLKLVEPIIGYTYHNRKAQGYDLRCLQSGELRSFNRYKIIKASTILNLNKKEDGKSSKEDRVNVQGVDLSIRRSNRGGKPRFTSSESEIRNRGGFSRKQKRPSFSQTSSSEDH